MVMEINLSPTILDIVQINYHIHNMSFNHLRAKHSPFYLKDQVVLRSKHFYNTGIKAGRWGFYRENFDAFPETRTRDINILWEESRILCFKTSGTCSNR